MLFAARSEDFVGGDWECLGVAEVEILPKVVLDAG